VVGAPALELDGQPGDLHLQVVDQLEAGVDVPTPRVGDRQAIEQIAAGMAEQIRHRTRVPEGDQRGVDAVLQRGAVADQVEPEPGQLALAPDARVGQPDRGHQIAPRQPGQHPRVDAVGLASQRRQALDLLRVSDEHFPAELLERVVHVAGAGHRLDHRPHTLPADALDEPPQALDVRRHCELCFGLAIGRQQAEWASSNSLLG
jgi:hypothetical protein